MGAASSHHFTHPPPDDFQFAFEKDGKLIALAVPAIEKSAFLENPWNWGPAMQLADAQQNWLKAP